MPSTALFGLQSANDLTYKQKMPPASFCWKSVPNVEETGWKPLFNATAALFLALWDQSNRFNVVSLEMMH